MTRTRRPPTRAGEPEETTFRGIQWRRFPGGALQWWDDEDEVWVRWRRGADAPPRPPGWEPAGQSIYEKENRPKWRSPYRIVPLVLVGLIIVFGAFQAIHGGKGSTIAQRAATQEATMAKHLVGRCLARYGTAAREPRYTTTPVPCDGPRAAVKVVAAKAPLARDAGTGAKCPAHTTSMALVTPGATEAYQLCIKPVSRHR